MAPGARSNLAYPCSNLRLLEANVLYWRQYLWHCWDFSAPSAVIWRRPQSFGGPIVIRCPRSCDPLPSPSLRPCCQRNQIQLCIVYAVRELISAAMHLDAVCDVVAGIEKRAVWTMAELNVSQLMLHNVYLHFTWCIWETRSVPSCISCAGASRAVAAVQLKGTIGYGATFLKNLYRTHLTQKKLLNQTDLLKSEQM